MSLSSLKSTTTTMAAASVFRVISIKHLLPHFPPLKWAMYNRTASQLIVYHRVYLCHIHPSSALRTNINFSSDTPNVQLSLVDPTLSFFPLSWYVYHPPSGYHCLCIFVCMLEVGTKLLDQLGSGQLTRPTFPIPFVW